MDAFFYRFSHSRALRAKFCQFNRVLHKLVYSNCGSKLLSEIDKAMIWVKGCADAAQEAGLQWFANQGAG